MQPVSSSRRTTPTKRSERPGWESSICQSQATWSRSKGMAASTSYCTVCSMRRASVKGRVTRWDAVTPGMEAAAETSGDQPRLAEQRRDRPGHPLACRRAALRGRRDGGLGGSGHGVAAQRGLEKHGLHAPRSEVESENGMGHGQSSRQ